MARPLNHVSNNSILSGRSAFCRGDSDIMSEMGKTEISDPYPQRTETDEQNDRKSQR